MVLVHLHWAICPTILSKLVFRTNARHDAGDNGDIGDPRLPMYHFPDLSAERSPRLSGQILDHEHLPPIWNCSIPSAEYATAQPECLAEAIDVSTATEIYAQECLAVRRIAQELEAYESATANVLHDRTRHVGPSKQCLPFSLQSCLFGDELNCFVVYLDIHSVLW